MRSTWVARGLEPCGSALAGLDRGLGMPPCVARKITETGASFPLLKVGGRDTIFIVGRFEGRATQSSDSIVIHT